MRGPKQSGQFLIVFQVGVVLGALAWIVGTVFLGGGLDFYLRRMAN